MCILAHAFYAVSIDDALKNANVENPSHFFELGSPCASTCAYFIRNVAMHVNFIVKRR